MENAVGMERVQWLGLLGKQVNRHGEHPALLLMCTGQCPWESIAGLEMALPARPKVGASQGCCLGAAGQRDDAPLPTPQVPPAAEIFSAAPVGLGMLCKHYGGKKPHFPPE